MPFKLKVTKDKSEVLDNKCVLYKINCKKYECCYEKYHNVITEHIKQHQFDAEKHDVCWDDIKILHKEKNWKKRCVAKMIYIKKQSMWSCAVCRLVQNVMYKAECIC